MFALRFIGALIAMGLLAFAAYGAPPAPPTVTPVAHRGLLMHSPENTLPIAKIVDVEEAPVLT